MRPSPSNPNQGDLPANLNPATRQARANAGIHGLQQLAGMTQAEAKTIHGIGPNELAILGKAMADRGLSFKPDNPEYKAGG